jgi:hypothetical protein
LNAFNSLALPGLFRTHNLILDADLQLRNGVSRYTFPDRFFYPRGYDKPAYNDIIKGGINYHFPLLYPDRGIFGIIYFLRARLNVFTDAALYDERQANGQSNTAELLSSGAELIFDVRLFNTYAATFGFRYSHTWPEDPADQPFTFFIPLERF